MIIYPGSIVYDENEFEYEVLEFIGNGSFGDVYKIVNRDNDKIFALKTIHASFPSHNVLKSFINEGNLALGISHDNVVKYFYFHDGATHNTLPPYIIMEYADQGNLQEKIAARSSSREYFNNEELNAIFCQLISGMDAINKRLIHRDIKPDNILISGGKYKVTDFGLSKIVLESTRASTFKGFGCIQYLAPEGWSFEKNTIQMDIYSMGFVFYELATLEHPLNVTGNDIKEWNEAHLFKSVKNVMEINPSISPILSQLIMRMIEKNTTDRYQNGDDIANSMDKQNHPVTPNTDIVENSLKNRLRQDTKFQEEKLKKEKREDEINNYKKIIKYQINKSIFTPIQQFTDEFNSKYEGSIIHLTPLGDYELSACLPSGENINVCFRAIIEEDFMREHRMDDYGREVIVTKLEMPQCYDRNIMAWGYIKGSDGRGFNLILISNKNEIYGEWNMLVNENSGLGREARPSPFPFEFNEIEREIKLIHAMHIYNTEIKALDSDALVGFFGSYV